MWYDFSFTGRQADKHPLKLQFWRKCCFRVIKLMTCGDGANFEPGDGANFEPRA